ncbi:hypothetical protein C3L33_21088, partial [Rhododendron williamsianum]
MHCSKILLYFLSIFWFLIPETKALNFNLTSIGPENQNVDITVFLAASISDQGLQVTSDVNEANLPQTAGKATYKESLHLWDNSTGNLTDFYTHFVFVIDSEGKTDFADGITFFLAPNGSNSWGGEAIGLPVDVGNLTSPFVAVEFDTFQNYGVDPVGINPVTHVGIDVNSLKSNVTAVWYCNITNGTENEAWIREVKQKKRTREFEVEMSMENEFESGAGPKKISCSQLSRATNNFEEEQKLGEGGFGGVYRGFLRELNSYIAVKKISNGSKQGIKEYATEVKIISRLSR